ncbi:MAG: hypothetical protein J6A30_09655 [Ruminococcus sp.]|nr:hypothetical protein [Ruminococcus sp.]
MKIYAITGWCGNEKYIEGYYSDRNTAYNECARMNKKRMIGLESLIVEMIDVDENATQENNTAGFVYEIGKTSTGCYQAFLTAVMYEDDYLELKKQGKAKSPLMANPYVWVGMKSEKKAIEAYIEEQRASKR